ncbi:Hypothetical protein BRZCDTV_408 [Brazilian cedratvirus IHUMI]|uniref:Uncharacterized protein n=1 Tax=Brazilian cedratvirus IHUMI TaxID=2126980 RepID=A0A2R8FEV1_9VIRU|nr:Hypothetical protein BRZCDTV_408 [Brazilian cedratvirus IHUMI]
MRTVHDLPPELLNMVYSYCPRDLTNAPPNVVQRCTEEGVYREALGGRRVPKGFTAKQAYEIYSARGKFIPLYYNDETYFVPIFPRTTVPQLIDEISNIVRESKGIELDISGQRISLGSVHPNLILNRGPMNVTSPLFVRRTKYGGIQNKQPNISIYDSSDSVRIHAL